MTEEMKTRIEERLKSDEIEFKNGVWPETKKGVRLRDADFAALGFRGGFQAGAKFILEMPELKEAVKSLNYYSNEKFDRVCFLDHSTCEENYGADARKTLEALKKAGLCD